MAARPTELIAAASSLTATGRMLALGAPVDGSRPGDQQEALLDAVTTLGAAGVRPVLIGGLAVGIRASVPRATMDVDLAAPSDIERPRVVTALASAGFEHRGSFAHSENFLHPSGEPVQVAFDRAMDAAHGRAEPVTVGDQVVHVVRTGDLISMKERAGNDPTRRRSKALRDLADAELLRDGGAGTDEGW